MIYVYEHRSTGEQHFVAEKYSSAFWKLVGEFDLLTAARGEYPKAVDLRPLEN